MHVWRNRKKVSVSWEIGHPSFHYVIRSPLGDFKIRIDSKQGLNFMGYLFPVCKDQANPRQIRSCGTARSVVHLENKLAQPECGWHNPRVNRSPSDQAHAR